LLKADAYLFLRLCRKNSHGGTQRFFTEVKERLLSILSLLLLCLCVNLHYLCGKISHGGTQRFFTEVKERLLSILSLLLLCLCVNLHYLCGKISHGGIQRFFTELKELLPVVVLASLPLCEPPLPLWQKISVAKIHSKQRTKKAAELSAAHTIANKYENTNLYIG